MACAGACGPGCCGDGDEAIQVGSGAPLAYGDSSPEIGKGRVASVHGVASALSVNRMRTPSFELLDNFPPSRPSFSVTHLLSAHGVPTLGPLALGMHPVDPSDIRDYPTEQPPWCSVTIRWSDGHTATVKSTVPAIVKIAQTIKRKDLEGVTMHIVVTSGDMKNIDSLRYTPEPK